MTSLTDRAEQALLGALLQDPGQIDSARFVTTADFASPQHQRIFAAIINACAGYRNGTALPRDLAVALATRDPELDVGQLRDLCESCPRPPHGAAYARMVMEASLHRELAAHAARLFEDADVLNDQLARFTNATGPGHDTPAFPGHLLKLAHAMLTHARQFDPGKVRLDAPEPRPEPHQGERARQEEEVLADLIHHCWLNSNVLEWLPAEAFTSHHRREIYQAITTLASNAEPIDELTVDWQIARNRTTHAQHPSESTPDPGYVSHLAAITVTEGTATVTGRILLNRHTTADLLNRTDTAHRINGNRPGSQPATTQARHGTPSPFRPHPARTTDPPLLPPPPGAPPGPLGPEPRP